MEGVDEYHLEAVVFGGLEVAWWEDRVQLDGSSFRRCMKRKSEINNTIETIILKPLDLGDSWNWLFFVNSVYSIINYYQNRNWDISTWGRHLHLREQHDKTFIFETMALGEIFVTNYFLRKSSKLDYRNYQKTNWGISTCGRHLHLGEASQGGISTHLGEASPHRGIYLHTEIGSNIRQTHS